MQSDHFTDYVGDRKAVLFPALCAVSAFFIRYLALPQNSVINSDGVFYATFGSRLISGDISDGISTYWSPLYSSLIGVTYLFTGDLEFAGRLVSLVAGSLLVIPAFILLRSFFGETPAYIGTILVTVHPHLVIASGWVMTESLYALIFTTAVLLGWFALENGRIYMFLLTGCLFGTAFLTKPESIGFVVLFTILTATRAVTRPRWEIKRLAAASVVFFIGFAVFFVPYVGFIYSKTGKWTVSQKLVSNSAFVEPGRGMLNLTEDGSTTLKDRIWWDDYSAGAAAPQQAPTSADPSVPRTGAGSGALELVSKILSNIQKQIANHMRLVFPLPFVIVGAIGFLTAPWTRDWVRKDLYLLSFIASTLIGYAATVVEVRYLYALVPILIGWVGAGCVEVGRFITAQLSNRTGMRRITPLAIQVPLLLLLVASLTPRFAREIQKREIDYVAFEEKAAGLWLRHNSHPGALVMAVDANVAFYAGAKHIFLPDEDVQTINEYAHRREVTHIVLSERRLKHREAIYGLANVDSLKLVYDDTPAAGYNVKIFRVEE